MKVTLKSSTAHIERSSVGLVAGLLVTGGVVDWWSGRLVIGGLVIGGLVD